MIVKEDLDLLDWTKIKIRGLGGYEISTSGRVRLINHHKCVLTAENDKNEKCVILVVRNKKKLFTIQDLMFKTFKKTFRNDIGLVDLQMLKKPSVFSENEDDYGLDENKQYWMEIKEYLNQLENRIINEIKIR